MSPALDTMPNGTKAKILRAVAGRKFNYELGSIASTYDITLEELQKLVGDHGYPTNHLLLKAATALEKAPSAPISIDTHATQADEPPAEGSLRRVRLEQLHSDPDNPRETLRDIEELADSIKEVGLLQPIVARRHQGQLIVVAGHRRLAAVRRLRWPDVATIVRADMRPDHVLAAMLIENGQRKDLDPIEEARGLLRLKTLNELTDREVGLKVGRNQVFVSSRLALLELTPEEQEQIRNGDMTLIEGTHRGRLNSGKVRPGAKGANRGWHLGPQHDLAHRAKARCKQLRHQGGRIIGGMACGECWEWVIRTDERHQLTRKAVTEDTCPTCGLEQHHAPDEHAQGSEDLAEPLAAGAGA